MRLKAQRTVIYVAMGLTMAALVGGYAAADLQMGSTNSQQQGTHTTSFEPITGATWTSTSLQEVVSTPVYTNCETAVCDVTSTSTTSCVGGVAGATACAAGDWVEDVTLSTVTDVNFTHEVVFTLYVNVNGTLFESAASYYDDSSGNSAQSISLLFGVGAAVPGNVTAVTIVGAESA